MPRSSSRDLVPGRFRGRPRPTLGAALGLALLLGCSSASVRPEAPGRGSFRAEARTFHLVFLRIPGRAFPRAMNLVSDLDLPEVRVDSAVSYPDFAFPFSFLNRILGYEWATVEGGYGDRER